MTRPEPEDSSMDAGRIKHCQMFGRWLAAGRITFKEYAYNITIIMVQASDACMAACVGLIPPDAIVSYAEYLRAFLEPVDFKPCPIPFLVGPFSEEKIERAKGQLRPRYLRLHQLVTERP